MTKSVSTTELAAAFGSLFTTPTHPAATVQHQRALSRWLRRYEESPADALALSGWDGQATRALFTALSLPRPSSKKAMLAALQT